MISFCRQVPIQVDLGRILCLNLVLVIVELLCKLGWPLSVPLVKGRPIVAILFAKMEQGHDHDSYGEEESKDSLITSQKGRDPPFSWTIRVQMILRYNRTSSSKSTSSVEEPTVYPIA